MKKDSRKRTYLQRAVYTAGWGIALTYAAFKVYRHLTRTSLEGKVVLITGGSRGLGFTIARQLARKGAMLAICARNQEQLDKAEKELAAISDSVMAVAADLTNPQEADKTIEQVITRYGRIDVLINNAGMMIVGPENVMEIDDYKKVMDTNLWAALHTIKAAMPHFEKQGSGHIVNICSIGAKVSVPHMLPYSVSKFALSGLSLGLASELARKHIKVTTVNPNLMRTGSPRNITLKGDHEAEYAWFKLSDSLPGISQSVESAAARIINAIELGEKELTLTLTGKVAVALQALAPELLNVVTTLANRFLPVSDDKTEQKGHQSETKATQGFIGKMTDKAAAEHNEI